MAVSDQKTFVSVRVPGRISRREAMQWVLAAVAASSLPNASCTQAASRKAGLRPDTSPIPGGYGTDPNLTNIHKPGSIWPLTLTPVEKSATKALADVILPKDRYGPAASEVGVVEMLDEWVSAPYPRQKEDRAIVIEGLAWIDAESARRFAKTFAELANNRQHAICDDICYGARAKLEYRKGAAFFSRFRSLAAGAYYSTPQGWEAIGYVGNVPLLKFEGPPQEVLVKLGLI